MEFDELKVIWEAQDESPMFAIDQTSLHALVRRKSRAFRRRIFWRDVREVGLGGVVAGVGFLVFGGALVFWDESRWRELLGPEVNVSRTTAMLMLIIAALWLFQAIFQLVARKRQQQRERMFEASLRGDIDRTLAQIGYQIRLIRTAPWWSMLPIWSASALFAYVLCTIVPTPRAVFALAVIVLSLSLVLDVRCKRRLLKNELLPLQREYESLRHKLNEPEYVA